MSMEKVKEVRQRTDREAQRRDGQREGEESGVDTGPCPQHTDAALKHAVSVALAMQQSMCCRGLGYLIKVCVCMCVSVLSLCENKQYCGTAENNMCSI